MSIVKLQVIIICYILYSMNFAEGTVLTSFTTRLIIIWEVARYFFLELFQCIFKIPASGTYFQNTGFLPAFAKLALKYRSSGNPNIHVPTLVRMLNVLQLLVLDLSELLQILCLFCSLCIALQPHTTSQSLFRLIAYRLNAITAFSHKIPESQTKTINTW